MRTFIFYLSFCILFSCMVHKQVNVQNSQFILVGTIHTPTNKVNSDSIFNILLKIKPDIILVEAETYVFEKENVLKKDFDGINSNEFQGIIKYVTLNPKTQVKPLELEGRNEFRKKLGIYSEAGFVFSEIDKLNQNGKLTPAEQLICKEFDKYWDSSSNIGKQDLRAINSIESDRIIDSLMQYQYSKIGVIIDKYPEFNNKKIGGSNGDSLSYRDYYKKWANFENKTRNEGISKNVINYYKNNPNKNIIALVGYKHRYFIKKYIESKIPTKEFYW